MNPLFAAIRLPPFGTFAHLSSHNVDGSTPHQFAQTDSCPAGGSVCPKPERRSVVAHQAPRLQTNSPIGTILQVYLLAGYKRFQSGTAGGVPAKDRSLACRPFDQFARKEASA